MIFDHTSEFKKELKKLNKKYKSLQGDIQIFRDIVGVYPCGNTKHFSILQSKDNLKIIKARFFCQGLRGSSMRMIYAFHENEARVVFIQLYYKGDAELQDNYRVKDYLQSVR